MHKPCTYLSINLNPFIINLVINQSINQSSMISNCIARKTSFLIRTGLSLAHFSTQNLAYTKGKPAQNLINLSIGEVFDQMTHKHPDHIFLNSYSQNVSFTYQKAH